MSCTKVGHLASDNGNPLTESLHNGGLHTHEIGKKRPNSRYKLRQNRTPFGELCRSAAYRARSARYLPTAFLVGAVLAWAFRVWILVPITLLSTIAALTIQLALGADFSTAVGHSLLIGLAPQLGYGFGLFARHTLLVLRSPAVPQSSRSASVAVLHTQRSVDQTR
jgi:hypothetical protein